MKRVVDEAMLAFLIQAHLVVQAQEAAGVDSTAEIDGEAWDKLQEDAKQMLNKYETVTELFMRVMGEKKC